MRRPSGSELVFLVLGISCFICGGDAARIGPGSGIFSGSSDVRGSSETMMIVRPNLLLQRKILEDQPQATTPNWAESKSEQKEKTWEPNTEEKKQWIADKPKEEEQKKWDSQPKAEEDKKEWVTQKPKEEVKNWDSQAKAEEKKEWEKPKDDVEKKWDSQPKAEEEKKEWVKPKEDVEKKSDSQPSAEAEKKEWEKPKEDVEKKWDSQPKAEEEKKEWIQEQPKKDEVAMNQQESKSAEKEPINVEEKKEETWQNQEPKKSEIEQQQIKAEEKKEAAWHQEEQKGEDEQQTKLEEKKEQQPWKPAEESNVESKEAETVEQPKATDENKSENQLKSNNNWEEKTKEETKVEETKKEPSEVEDRKEEPKTNVDIKETMPKVDEKKEEKPEASKLGENQEERNKVVENKKVEEKVEENNESSKLQQEKKKEQQQAQQVQQQKNEDNPAAVAFGDAQSDHHEDYPDFLDELRNFPERFHKTAESVKNHIRYSGLDRYSTQSKELFNQANQQIQESFTPLLGKDYAPLLAYLVSYGLLLLPLVLVTYLLERIRARYSLQKILLFMNIYLSAYFAALLFVSVVLNTEPMNFFMKYSTSSYIFLQLLQAFGYLMYLLLNTADLISTCSNGRIAAKFSSLLQFVVVVAAGFHYYVTVFHRAMARKAPLTSWKIYGLYSLSFIFLCFFARIERGKKQYTPMEVDDTTDKKN